MMKSAYCYFRYFSPVNSFLSQCRKYRESLKGSLSGKITDKKTGEVLPGVNIYFPDLKTGTTTDTDGNYKIDNLPQTKVSIQLSYISYRTVLATVDLSALSCREF